MDFLICLRSAKLRQRLNKEKALWVKGTAFGNGDYSILIQPSGKDCMAPQVMTNYMAVFFLMQKSTVKIR